MTYDDQYDAPLSGPERARLRALELAIGAMPLVDGESPADRAERWVEMARPFEQFIFGKRATGVKEQIEAAYTLADRVLSESGGDPWSTAHPAPGRKTIEVDGDQMRELVRMLSRLADGAPF